MSPMRQELYPDNWPEISLRIRQRAGWRCEFFGAENGKPHPETGSKVVLTVAHYPDPDPMNCADSNLHSLCQLCHNRLDAPMRAKNRKRTLQNRRAATMAANGQLTLWGDQNEHEVFASIPHKEHAYEEGSTRLLKGK